MEENKFGLVSDIREFGKWNRLLGMAMVHKGEVFSNGTLPTPEEVERLLADSERRLLRRIEALD